MAYTTIDDPSAFFQVALHSSANAATIANDGNSDLKPDLIWSKARGAAYNHALYDSTRGVTKFLVMNNDAAEVTSDSGYDLISFNTDGFSTGNNQHNIICGNTTYVAWQWKCNGGTTSTNTAGDVNSTVQVNTDAGLSIVSWSATNTTARNIGHGLGVEPDVIIIRNRNRLETTRVYFKVMGHGATAINENYSYNTTSTALITGATSTTFGVGTDFSVNGNYTYMAYCFKAIQGFSKFSKYVGNGNTTTGPFIYTGFKPRFVMIKSTTNSGSHVMWDSKRSPINVMDDYLVAAEADAEGTNGIYNIDFVSNGFKIKNAGTNNGLNQANTKYVYYAFAENPFTTSTGIPATAR